ncbi:MAG: M14 family metallopeptidase [Vicinamibacteria bacterium]
MRNVLVAIVLAGAIAPAAEAANDITPPETFFGFQLGADRKLARWDRIVEYYRLLEKESDRIRVIDLGPSTEGNPYLLAIVTSPKNMENLERLREVNLRIQSPDTPEGEIEKLIHEGRAVVSESFGLHATEVSGAQTAPELTYDLLARDDEETLRILDQTILLLFPCFNPDGQIMVADWYQKNLGTEFEGHDLPWLYHKYVGHDNNRDADFLNMVEAKYTAKVLYRDWKPQAYVDHHQMGSYGARFYVPPYGEPIRPYADPLLWRELSWYGGHIAYKLEENGKAGVLNAGQYPGWGHFGWHWITPFHNISGMLTESASASLATPLYLHPEQLRGGARAFPVYEAQSTMPNPWPGGWWRLRDIVEQQKIAAWAILDLAARNRETVLRTSYLKAKRQTERGAAGSPKAYVIPRVQHDPMTALHMIETLLASDIQIEKARKDFTVGGKSYEAGSHVISLAQPKMGLVRNLLGRTLYPDNEWTRARDGSPLRPYDTATHTMAELMGVRVDPVEELVEGDFERLTEARPVAGKIGGGASFRLDGRMNASFAGANLLLDENVRVSRVDEPSAGLRRGDFIVTGGSESVLAEVARETGLDFEAVESVPSQGVHELKRLRVGMYQRYRGGNMDEGWTRFVLEQFHFPYRSIKDAEIQEGGLEAKYDVIIFPHDSTAAIEGREEEPRPGQPQDLYPPEYRSGIDEKGIESLKAFVEEGGTLVTFGEAAGFAIEKLGLNVRNVVEDVSSKEFFCPGSTLKVRFDDEHPLAQGMPSSGLVLFWESPVFEILPSRDNDRYEIVASYVDRDVLQSGWLVGEKHLAKKAAMVLARHGKGEVVLIGFRPQHRAQTHGTFKVLFNALVQ